MSTVTTEFICSECYFRGMGKVFAMNDTYLEVDCPKCASKVRVPRNSVYLSSFEFEGMVKNTPPTAEVSITMRDNNGR